MQRILVTGGCGFIGSAIVDQLVERGLDVVVLDNLTADVHPSRPDYLRADVRYLEADVRDPGAWATALDGVDAVCHQAAKVGLGVDFGDAPAYVGDNDVGTAAGLWAMHRAGFDGRIVLASSMVVYGEGRYRCDEHGIVRPAQRRVERLDVGDYEPPCPRCDAPLAWTLVDEDAPTDPRNVYAATKLHQEHLCSAFAHEHGTTVTSLRYHNVYGPRMPRDTPYAGVAAIFRSALERGESPRVFEDGGQMRDFVHVDDVARANVAALTTSTPYDGALNVASGSPHSVLDMAEALCDAAGSVRPTVVGGHRLGDVRHVVASADRLADALGVRAQVAFADGMAEFVNAPLRRPASADAP
ncbi:MAG: NAD-dependent epimerase/dehydratase family protein [Acidimicrobiales bacterium]